MRNLKKVLGLVLCLAMMLSIMVVGAAAAFSDAKDINTKHQEAVDACVALNIINGKPDGSFAPNENVTREQMTKMICVLLNGGKEPNLPAASSFTDVPATRWSAPYISSCLQQGIVAGVGGNKFNPEGAVTGSAAAKMLLVSLGYDQEAASFVGSNWEVNVNVAASAKGFYEDLEDINPSAPLSREHAAQMVWNALNADEVEYTNILTTDANGQLVSKTTVKDRTDVANNKITLLKDKYKAETKEDELLISVKEDSKGTYTVKTNKATYTKVEKDCTDLLGQKVDIMVKDKDNSKVFGIYATDDNTVTLKTTAGQIDTFKAADKTIKVDGTKYNLDKTKIVYTTTVETSGEIATKLVNATDEYQNGVSTASTVYLVSNDGDNKIDVIVIIPAEVVKVNYVGSSSITLANGIGTVDKDDFTAYDGMKKGDFVLYTPEKSSTAYLSTIEKVDIVSGTINGVKNTTEARIDGTYYKQGTGYTGSNPKANDKVDAAVYANRYYDLDAVSAASADDLLFIIEAGVIKSGVASGVEAVVLFADGSQQTIVIDDIYDPTNDNNYNVANAVKLVAANDPVYADYTQKTVVVGALYTYEKDGTKYDLTPLLNKKNDAGYDTAAAPSAVAYKESKSTLQGNRIDDNAIIFVAKEMGAATGADAKVITGKELKTWGSDYGSLSQTLSNTKNGVDTVMVGTLISSTDSYGSETGNYGIITSDPETVKVGGKTYVSFNLWNGKEDVQTIATSMSKTIGKGDVVKYDTDGTEGNLPKIKTITRQTTVGAMLSAETNGSKFDVTITGPNGAKTPQTIYTVDSDTTVLFINDDTGVQGGSITDYAAIESAIDNVFIPNVIYVPDGNNLDLIVIDVRGELGLTGDLVKKSSLPTEFSDVDIGAKTITLKNDQDLTVNNETLIATAFDNVLSVKKVSNTQYTVVSTNGTAYSFTVSLAS